MYQVIGTRASRTFRVLWMLEELGEPYKHNAVSPRSNDVLAVNPSGKLPTLLDGDNIITESAAIVAYLADKHGSITYAAGTLERAHQDAFTYQIQCDIDGLLWTAARHSFVLPEDKRVPDVIESVLWEYPRNLRLISNALRGPFLMGDMMTVPDILLAHCLRWAELAGFPEPDDNLAAYMTRMESRPAFMKVRKLP